MQTKPPENQKTKKKKSRYPHLEYFSDIIFVHNVFGGYNVQSSTYPNKIRMQKPNSFQFLSILKLKSHNIQAQ